MTRKELDQILRVLRAIKEPDAHVILAVKNCEKQIAMYDARQGQLRDMYEVDSRGPW